MISLKDQDNILIMDQLSLFNSDEYDQFPKELLEYTEHFLSAQEAKILYEHLMDHTPWRETSKRMYDKTILTPRLTAWYGDERKSHQLGSNSISTNPWSPELLFLKQKIEKTTGYQFNSVLLNLYRDKNDSVAWHRDKDNELGTRPVIASVTLGQVRNFDFRKVDDHQKKHSLPLSNGSLLIMKGNLQVHWEHRIAKSTRPMQPRINLTFRLIRE